MTSHGRALLRDLALLIGLPVVLAVGLSIWLAPWQALFATFHVTPYAPRGGDVFAVVQGRWDWVGKGKFCEANWHDIRFSPDRSTMTFESKVPAKDSTGTPEHIWVYDIVASDSTRIRGAIRGEDRMDDAGKPVVWDLVLTGPDTYRWHRVDWSNASYTAEIRRCPG